MATKHLYPLNTKTAITYSITISIFWCSLMVIAGLLGGRYTEDRDGGKIFIIARILWFLASKIILLFSLFIFDFAIFKKQWTNRKKYFLSLTGTPFITLIISFFTFKIEQIIFHIPIVPAKYFFAMMFLLVLITSSLVLIITLMLHISYQKEIEQKLITENILSRYEALKNQIDPHFLFNSLNTLNGLIGLDDAKAREYVYKLSSVFRYAILNKEITTLEEELEFTKSFCYLMKIRYDSSLQIDYKINDNFLEYRIMPLSLQLLIENAIKHNVISNKRPLTITVETTDSNFILVSNKIQAKNEASEGAGIGLANLSERYKLLFQKKILINKNNDTFVVKIPLIKSEK